MPALTGTAYVLLHAPDVLRDHGSTQAMERLRDPDSPCLAKLGGHLRGYQAAVGYAPNQAFIGNLGLDELGRIPRPWHAVELPGSRRFGPFGEIMPQEEFYGLLKLADAFDLVSLERAFTAEIRARLEAHPRLPRVLLERLGQGRPAAELEALASGQGAAALRLGERLVGCVRRAHEIDENLSAHVMLENLAAKASAALAVLHLLARAGAGANEIDYLLECSEEACGDMNQRGGGNFAKAVGELCGLTRATGSDVRGFCAGPAHAIMQAGALVEAGVFRRVVVAGGGCVAKLGMNARDHVAKGLPALEDTLGAFALLIERDDGVSPLLRLDALGKLDIGAGASPQQVMKALVSEPLAKLGRKICDVDRFCAELQNPEITEPAGAGNVPEANTRMIAALAVMAGEIGRADIPAFTAARGLPGFAPTQGHIPSGVPALGFVREQMLAGKMERALLIGKGSLFLGRMTNLFDGLSLVIERNPAQRDGQTRDAAADPRPSDARRAPSSGGAESVLRIGVPLLGGEHGPAELLAGAEAAQAGLPGVEVVAIGPAGTRTTLALAPAEDEAACAHAMRTMLADGRLAAAVAMHHCFPLGVATVGLAATPARGKPLFVACTTGMSAPRRVPAMLLNAVYGVSAAKAWGIAEPTVGVLNVEGARSVERRLRALAGSGWPIRLTGSGRADAESVLRGNDILRGAVDVLVCDSLTGNVLMKLLSAFTTGGGYESAGWGYGPGVGGLGGVDGGNPGLVSIVSRASGAPVVAGAVRYAAAMVRGDLRRIAAEELAMARAAGLEDERAAAPSEPPATDPRNEPEAPAKKAVTEQIAGIDVLELEDARRALWAAGIYAESGMGCTGPVILLAPEDLAPARTLLLERKLLGC